MTRAEQDRQYLEAWVRDAEARDEPALFVVLQIAHKALTSGSPRRIYDALITCLATGRSAGEYAHRNAESKRQRAGGQRRGEQQIEKANEYWAPHRARYKELVESGKSGPTALAIIRREMGSSAPSDKTLRKQLVAKNSEVS